MPTVFAIWNLTRVSIRGEQWKVLGELKKFIRLRSPPIEQLSDSYLTRKDLVACKVFTFLRNWYQSPGYLFVWKQWTEARKPTIRSESFRVHCVLREQRTVGTVTRTFVLDPLKRPRGNVLPEKSRRRRRRLSLKEKKYIVTVDVSSFTFFVKTERVDEIVNVILRGKMILFLERKRKKRETALLRTTAVSLNHGAREVI